MPAGPLGGRENHAMLWTGKEVLILGGTDPQRAAHAPAQTDAAAYDPATRRWRKLADGPPLDGWGTEAVWTGKEAILWGGRGVEDWAIGAAYDPATNRWRVLPDAPIVARKQPMVWTGKEAIVWGAGEDIPVPGQQAQVFADGAAYNPATNTWRKLAASPLSPRFGHSAYWTGTRMIIWGGGEWPDRPEGVTPSGALYDPTTDTWEVLPEAPFPAREYHASVWTGDRLMVWGGGVWLTDTAWEYDDGAIYDPATRRWEMIPRSPMGFRSNATAVWTGRQMIVWGGGEDLYRLPPYGAAYDPVTRRWSALPAGPLHRRNYHRMIWTGDEVLIWGGYRFDGQPNFGFSDGAAYRPSP